MNWFKQNIIGILILFSIWICTFKIQAEMLWISNHVEYCNRDLFIIRKDIGSIELTINKMDEIIEGAKR